MFRYIIFLFLILASCIIDSSIANQQSLKNVWNRRNSAQISKPLEKYPLESLKEIGANLPLDELREKINTIVIDDADNEFNKFKEPSGLFATRDVDDILDAEEINQELGVEDIERSRSCNYIYCTPWKLGLIISFSIVGGLAIIGLIVLFFCYCIKLRN